MRGSVGLITTSWLILFAGCSGVEEIGDGQGSGGADTQGSGGAHATGGAHTMSGGTLGGGGLFGSGGMGQPGGGSFASGGGFGQPDGGSSSGGGFGQPSGGGPNNSGGNSSGGAGASSGGSGPVELDCDAQMPSSGATEHAGNGQGGSGNLAWEIWSNTGNGNLTSYSVPAFKGLWNESGGYLGRLGFEWGGFGSTPKPYEEYGTITAQFASKKTGSAGGYSYIGMYGWSTDPCVEWYVVDDSFNSMPINPGTTTEEGQVEIDDEVYIMYTRPTTGSGGTRCSGVNNWMQYYSVRKKARACGQISLTEHFDAWKELGMPLGNLLEAKILIEVVGGVGNVKFSTANVMTSQ